MLIPNDALAWKLIPWTPVFTGVCGGSALKPFYVYILASQKNGTLYTGSTDDISKRVWEHKQGQGAVFTRKYAVHRLVWLEPHDSRDSAKTREYQIKAWKRAWKIKLIEADNPDWLDLYLKLNH